MGVLRDRVGCLTATGLLIQITEQPKSTARRTITMAPERRLIPAETDDPPATRVQCSSNVVGVIPPQIHEILASSPATTGRRPRHEGRLDDHASGVSYLVGSGRGGVDDDDDDDDDGSEGSSAIFSLWEHSTHTLNEELVPPSGLCARLAHPEHRGGGGSLLVACLGPNDGGGAARYGADRAAMLRHVYAASPATGVLCVWVLDSNNPHLRGGSETNDGRCLAGPECDASVRLRLGPREILTALTPVSNVGSTGGTAWLLAATSTGMLWKVYKTSRPLTLHAKLVKSSQIAEGGLSSTSTEEEEGAGIVRGLYNYFTTPSKKSVRLADARHAEEARGDDAAGVSDEEEAIAALVPLPRTASNEERMSGATRSPPPRKQPRMSTALSDASTRVLSLSRSLVLKEWRVSLLAGSEGDDAVVREGCVSKSDLFPRNVDGTLNLERLLSKFGNDAEDNLAGYCDANLLASPSLSLDGRSLLAIVRIEKDDAEGTRAYLLRIALLPLAGEERRSPYILDAAWLDRYSGQSLSSAGGTLECAGLVAAEEAEEENVHPARVFGGLVAYVAFGPRGDTGYNSGGGLPPCPVTISAIHFPSTRAPAEGRQQQQPRIKDLDLFSNIVLSLVKNSMSYDSLTGGCVFLAMSGLLGGASVRFPPSNAGPPIRLEGVTASGAGSLEESLARDEMVLTIKSHLQSAFRQYLNRLREGGGGGNPARAVIPPSVGTCSSQVLSAAVVLASKDLVCAPGGGGGSSIPTSPYSLKAAASPVTVLRDKLQMHGNFVNFLIHAGAYRRVSTSGRIGLRDHAEIITAARALLVECQSYFSNAEAAAAAVRDDARQGELAQARKLVMADLEGASDNVINLPRSWARLQQHFHESGGGEGCSPLEKDLILLTSSSICRGIGQALRYRQNESGRLYDVPSHSSASLNSHGAPWTSSPEMLEVLFAQLRAIQCAGESILSAGLEDAKVNLRRYVEDICASALSGHRDVFLRKPDDEEAIKSYEETKLLSIPLLRKYANDDGDDLLALQSSLAHSFFEGIVQICYDHIKSWKFRGPFSDKEADMRYDLRPMLSNTSSTSTYAHLHQSRDYRTGLPFCGYVLRWYADRGLFPDVFELGKNCPHDLTRYVRNDDRMSDLAWIQHLQVGAHEQATVGLLSLTSPVLFGDKKDDVMGLWEKDQLTSLAKLSNKLASAKSANRTVGIQRNQLIANTLTLLSAQRILQEDTEVGDEVALKADDLLRLATEKITASRDVDEIKRFGICGLAIASAKPPNQSKAMSLDASSIWNAVIQADIHTWKSVAHENCIAVGGISEEELIQRVEGTAFVGVMYDFVMTSPSGEKMQNVGFLHDPVRNQVLHSLGSDELANVLSASAEIVLAAV